MKLEINKQMYGRALRKPNDTNWEYMGEQVKMDDGIANPPPVLGEDISAGKILQAIREKGDENKSQEQAKREQQFGADLYMAVEQDNQLCVWTDDGSTEPEPTLTFNTEAEALPEFTFRRDESLDHSLTISDNNLGELVKIHTDTGEVEYGEHYTPDLAADIFWRAMGQGSPQALNAEIAELKGTIDTYGQYMRALEEKIIKLEAPDDETIETLSTSTVRVGIARLVAFVKRNMGDITEQFIFEPNDATTHNKLANALDIFLSDLQSRRFISTYEIVCDESNNAPNTNVLNADVAFCKETGSDFIHIPIRITPHTRIEHEMALAMSADIVNEIDQEVIADLIAVVKKSIVSDYDDAMKVI